MKQNKQFILLQQKILHNKKVYNDLFYLTKQQQQRDGYKYSTAAIQYNDNNYNIVKN